MFSTIKRLATIPERLRCRLYPKVAEYRLNRSTKNARRILGENGPLRVLIDNSVLANAVTHETQWIKTGKAPWGDGIRGTGYAARVPVHWGQSDSFIFGQVCYLPGIACLANAGLIELYQSAELRSERDRQPIGLYRGYSWLDYSIFGSANIPSVDGDVCEIMTGWPPKGPGDWAREQRARLESSGDPLYTQILSLLPAKSNQDAWHIRTAERHGLFCFLTMDRKLLATCHSQRKKEPFKSLKTKILSPQDFAAVLGIQRVPPRLLSYNDSSFFVRADLTMPGNKRRSRSDYA